MSHYLEIIVEYLQCGNGTEYKVDQILAASDFDVDSKSLTLCQMTAVNRCHTSFFVNDKDPLISPFVYGDDICLCSVDTVIFIFLPLFL